MIILPWRFITHLGDSSLLAPSATIIAIWLLLEQRTRLFWYWSILLAGALALVAASKIAFFACGFGIQALNFTGFSGHSTFSMALWPVAALLLVQRQHSWVQVLGVGAGYVLALLIGASRLVLHLHSLTEVLAGCVLGALVSISFIWVAGTPSRPLLNRWLLALGLCVLVGGVSSQTAPTQRWFVHLALTVSGHQQPYTRENWRSKPSIWIDDRIQTCAPPPQPFDRTLWYRLKQMTEAIKTPSGLLQQLRRLAS